MNPVQIILVDPKDIKKMSGIAGCRGTRRKRIEQYKYQYAYPYLHGDWDLTKRLFENSGTFTDYELFKNGKKAVYNWERMYNKIKTEGFVQDPTKRYIEVGIGRTGELFMVDGRHRLFLAQKFNIPKIPVNIVYRHPDYNCENLSIIKNPVIPEFIYDKIASKWNIDIKIYHHWGTINHRYNLVKDHLPLLKDLNVLEIGCNSGMMMWSIMKHAKSLIEVEKLSKYYNQCKITCDCLKSMHKGNVTIYNHSFKEFIASKPTLNINALYASFVLYHMNDEEIELLKKIILPKCKVVIIPNRNKERRSCPNSLYLNRPKEIEKLLQEANFKTSIINPEKGYSVIKGEKNVCE